MSDREPVLTFVGILIVVCVALIAAQGYEGFRQTQTERFCLSHGYARADWRWIGPDYCITRTDQTDVVVPVESVK